MIYTFYSFKGGVGRSMALANVAEYFYRKGLRVTIIDWDLEAPGLETFYFNPRNDEGKEQLKKVRSQLGLMDALTAYQEHFPSLRFPSDEAAYPALQTANGPIEDPAGNGKSDPLGPDIKFLRSTLPSIQTYLYPIHAPESHTEYPEAALWLMQAGWREGDRFSGYTRTVQGFGWVDFYVKYKGKAFFEWMRQELEAISDVILIDSRTGITEMGGVCTQQLADVVVCCSILNSQNMEGVARMMKSFTRDEVIKARDGRPIWTFAVPTRIDVFEIDARAKLFDLFGELIGQVPEQFQQAQTNYERLIIPYVAKYAYFERLAIGANDRAYELENAYRSLATHLALFAPSGSALRLKLADDLDRVLRVSESPVPHMAPPLPAVYIERRNELNGLKGLLMPSDNYGSETVVVSGPAGCGKTVLAAAAGRDGEVVNVFKDGILWVTLGANPNIQDVLTALYTKLTGDTRTFTGEEEAHKHLTARMHGKMCLIVLDDLCYPAQLMPFATIRNQGALLVTTRDPNLAQLLDTKELQVQSFSDEQALNLVDWVSRFPPRDREALADFVSQLTPQPLNLRLAGDRLRQQIEIVGEEPASALNYAAQLLNERGVTAFDRPEASDRNQSISLSVGASLKLLSHDELELYIQLLFALDNKKLTLTDVTRLWERQSNKTDNTHNEQLNTEEKLQRFNALSLVEYDLNTRTVKIDAGLRTHLLAQLPTDVGLDLKAENIYSKLAPDDQELMQQALVRLVKLGADSNLDTRANVKLTSLEEGPRRIVKNLITEGILTQEEDKLTKEVRVKFADDSLIKKWGRLRDWIGGDREFLLWLQQIRPAFESWRADPRYGFLQGEDLAIARHWMAERPHLDQAIWTYVTVSDEANRKERWKRIGVLAIAGLLAAMALLSLGYRLYQNLSAWKESQERTQWVASRYREGLDAANRSDYAGAIKLYTEAQQRATERNEQLDLYNARGNAYSAQGNYAAAIEDFNQLLRIDPQSAQAHFNRGLTLQRSGNNASALYDFDEVLRLTTDGKLTDSARQQIRDIYKVPSDQESMGWAQFPLHNNDTNKFDIQNFRKILGDPNDSAQVGDALAATQSSNLRESYVELNSDGTWVFPPAIDVIQPRQVFTVLAVHVANGNGTWVKLERVQTHSGIVVIYYSAKSVPSIESTFPSLGYQVSYGGPPPIPGVKPDVRYYFQQDQDDAEQIVSILQKLGFSVSTNSRMDDPTAVRRHSRGDIEVWLQ